MDFLLPVGSVVTLKNSNKKYMVAGYSQSDDDKIYSYKGIDYRYGYNEKKKMKLFNEEDIKTVLFMGYYTLENLYFLTEYKKYMDIIKRLDPELFLQQILNGESNEYTEFVNNLINKVNENNEDDVEVL